jgi:two-component system phosphate regulon sensor histidine kinase PhoR
MQRHLRWKVILPYLLLLSVVAAVFSILTVQHLRQREIERWQTQLMNTAQWIASESRSLDENHPDSNALDRVAQEKSAILGFSIFYLDKNGKILGASEPAEENLWSSSVINESTWIDEDSISAAALIKDNNNQNAGFVLLDLPHTEYQNDFSRVYWQAFAMTAVTGVGMVLIALIINDRTLEPIEKMTIAAQQMTMGNFDSLEFPRVPDELRDLNAALQMMAEQLGKQINALTTERTKLSAVLNQMTDGVLIVDPEGRVQLLNPTAERLFVIPEEQALGRSVVEVLRHHQLVDVWRQAKSGLRQSTMLEIGPQHLFLQVVGIPLKSALPGSTLILFQDLTQLRRLETIRRDFISNVSHELRTPLASLKALAETLQEGALEDPPAARRFILRMETEIDNLIQLVNELLELSRIESGKVPLSFQRKQPCELLKPAYDRMQLQAERAGLEMTLECQPELPPVFADPDRISQVLINLVHNAIKFTAPGGKITLSAYRDQHQIVFFVRDNGVGIEKKDLGRIFERFYKVDRSRTSGGTGLGLSIARHMIETHGGHIWVESEQGLGSTFYFSLPIA